MRCIQPLQAALLLAQRYPYIQCNNPKKFANKILRLIALEHNKLVLALRSTGIVHIPDLPTIPILICIVPNVDCAASQLAIIIASVKGF